ncbi:MAG: ChaN family lipoprotein [Gammaproteobacteria bacterium]
MIRYRALLLVVGLNVAVSAGCQGASLDTGGRSIVHGRGLPPTVVTFDQSTVAEVADSAPVLEPGTLSTLDGMVAQLAGKRVIFIGENHDRLEHHLVQLAILSRLYQRRPALAVGMEFFQIPFQRYLDEYVAGRLDDSGLLEATEYFDRWGYDYRLYQPILQFAKTHGLPVVALNASNELVKKVSEGGIAGLAPSDRAQLPADMAPADAHYRARLRSVFDLHPTGERKEFGRFVEVQLLWDEAMAETVAKYLQRHAKRSLVVLAGNGHLAYRSGIPDRLQRRIEVDDAVVLNGADSGIEPGIADYVVLPESRALPPAGRLGVLLDAASDTVRIKALDAGSAGAAAGVRSGDILVELGGRSIGTLADVKIALWDKLPGERVLARVRRDRGLFGQADHLFDVELQ